MYQVTHVSLSKNSRSKFIQKVYRKGLYFWNEEKHEEALECFDMVLRTNPEDTNSLYHKGIILDLLGKYNEAICAMMKF